MNDKPKLIFRFRLVLSLFIIGLVLSGVTAFPLQWELNLLCDMLGVAPDADLATLSGLNHWIAFVRQGVVETYTNYPFLAYGTDWLAFAHITIAVFFIGPLIKPTENDWILISGMIACLMLFPLALIAGPIRGIPFYWRLVDCSFGFFGLFPLAYCYLLSKRIKLAERS